MNKKSTSSRTPKRRMNVYSNLSHKRKTRKDQVARKKAEYLASLPKHPLKRTLYRLSPKRLYKYWFSKEGLLMALKLGGLAVLAMFLVVGGLFAYYRKDIDQIRPSELAKRVQTTVSRYYDRNGLLLWEDKGDGDYKLVVEKDEIADTMRQATVAIEDKDFYRHHGVSFSGILRAAINNTQGQSVQGGSTLTQQLVKQVFFPASEVQERGIAGIPRKIKEVILAVEVERMYDKAQILNLYLNESSYGGRRNGVESAANTYFNKHAKDLTLAESALLAAIPNQPGLYNPYNTYGNEALISRQHKVLNSMVSQGYITKSQAEKAKKDPVLDRLQPEADQFKNIKAPHFVMMVRSELESKLGKATVGRGGLNVTTTIDLRVQNRLQSAMKDMFDSYYPAYAGFSNGAATIEDVKTGQIIAMLGSRGFNYPGFGQDNAATAFIQPGSSIKPLVYAQLFQDKGQENLNFGSGSVLSDSRITFADGYSPRNADGGYKGNITIRNSLDWSRNIPAIKAMQISGIEPTMKTIRLMGDKYYCTQGQEKQVGLSAAIGGCGTRMVDHVNAIASLARGGVYMPTSSILKVTNSNGDVLQSYEKETKRVIDKQAAYVVNDILGDSRARAGLFGRSITPITDATGVKIALKTGTSDKNEEPKDIWTVGYTPHVAGAVWLGNPDTTPLANGNSSIPAQVLDPVMAYASQLYIKEGKAKATDWFSAPAGIQRIGSEVYPSWYNKSLAQKGVKMTFDQVSKKKASKCTPEAAKIELTVTKMIDPVSKKDIFIAPDGYDATESDNVHKCSDQGPSIGGITVNGDEISVRVDKGTFPLDTLTITVDGRSVASMSVKNSGTYTTTYGITKKVTIGANVTDSGFYSDSSSQKYNPGSSGPPGPTP